MTELIGKTISQIAEGQSFIEITFEDGTVLDIETTNEKSNKHQDYPDIKTEITNE